MKRNIEGQISFDFEEKAPEEPAKKPESEKAIQEAKEKTPAMEAKDECQYCGQEFEGPQSCPYCMNNSAKRAWRRGEGN